MDTPIKRNQTPLIIAVVAIGLCCCCVLLTISAYYAYITTSRTQGIPTDIFETEPVLPNDSQAPTSEPFASPGEAPIGGLANEILRNDTWQAVAAAAVGLGCDQPVGADTEIDVLQQPQNGIWVEKWTVACQSGDLYPFEVEYILDATGATFNIKSLPE
jgi:hypothetical protein